MHTLQAISTKAPKDFDKKETKENTAKLAERLSALQNLLYAHNTHAVLVILQGMDASGKDGAIKKVFGKLNPQGVSVVSFKTPSEAEKAHDFLWRVHMQAPAKGMIQVFNRSHYEDVLITRVHDWCEDETATQRFRAINDFEQLLALHNQTHIFKFYLHVSAEEQEDRLKERVNDPAKQWKYNKTDSDEAKQWNLYRKMYEDVFENCNKIPWTIVPADQNWYKEYLISKTIVEGLEALKMQYPKRKE